MSNLRSSSTGTANTGIRSIREMFEKGGSNADSASPRGLSPADSVNSGERPTRKVRTSFVAVEPSGMVDVGGEKADGAGIVNGTDGSNRNIDPIGSAALNGKSEPHVMENKERTPTKEGSTTLQNGNDEKTRSPGVDGDKTPSKATDANQARNNPKFKAKLDQIVAKSAINGTGEQEKSGDRSDSKMDSQTPPRSNAERAKVESKSPMNKGKDTSGKSPRINGNNSNNNESIMKLTNEINRESDKSEKSTKSPLSTPKRSKAASTMNNSSSILSPRNVALPKSPNSCKSVTKSAQGMQGSPTKMKGASVANAKSRVSSSGIAAKLPGSGTEKSSVKSPSSSSSAKISTSTARKDISSTRKSSITAASSQKLANSKEKRASLPPATGNAAKIPGLKGSTRASIGPNNIISEKKSDSPEEQASQPLKSPRRSGPLSAHLTAPTASSTAKNNSQSSQSSQSQSQSFASSTSAVSRKSSTMTRDKTAGTAKLTKATSVSSARPAPNTKKTTSTSTSNSRIQHSRASLTSTLPRDSTIKSASSRTNASSSTTSATATYGTESSHSSNVRSPGKSFLDRMTRPTASFASKTHEKVDVKSPPPRRSASVRTRQKPTLGETGRNAGSKATAGDSSSNGPISRTRALQDALIGSKGRKQGFGASTGPAAGTTGSRKGTLGSSSGPTARKETVKGKEGIGKDQVDDEVGSTGKEKDSEQASCVPKQEKQNEETSTKEKAVAPSADADDHENNKQMSSSEANAEKNLKKEEEEKSDEILKAEPAPEIKPAQEDVETEIDGSIEGEKHVNGNGIDDGDAVANNTVNIDDKSNEGDSKDTVKNIADKPAAEQDIGQDTTVSSDGISDPFVVETPKFERTVIR